MTKYLLIRTQQYSENTSQYGYGDYPVQIDYIAAVVEGDTVRKAQNAARKLFPHIRFGGMFSPTLVPATPENIAEYAQLDCRLWGAAAENHIDAMSQLAEAL